MISRWMIGAAILFGTVAGIRAQEAGPAAPAGARKGISTVPAEARQRADAFFALLRMKKVEEAYAQLFEGSTVAVENPETVSELVASTNRLLESTGEIAAAEFVRVRHAGRTLIEGTWILNGRKRPVRWRIYFYQTGGAWQVLDTDVSTRASVFFDEPAGNESAE